jgi:hypothetical protein
MQIDESDEQYENAESRISDSFEAGTKSTVQRFAQWLKQAPSMVSTDAGMVIDESDEQDANVDCPEDERVQPDSNVTVEREPHPEKQQSESASRAEEM